MVEAFGHNLLQYIFYQKYKKYKFSPNKNEAWLLIYIYVCSFEDNWKTDFSMHGSHWSERRSKNV